MAHTEVEVDGDEPTALYRFYGSDGVLLYVGITVNLTRRWEGHAADKAWWPLVARKTAVLYGTRKEAIQAEAVAIIAESPVHNVAGQVPAGGDKELEIKRLERRLADAERSLRLTSFTLDEGFQADVDAYAKAHGFSSFDAVGVLLRLGLARAEEIAAVLAA